jgi:hypothetical protein
LTLCFFATASGSPQLSLLVSCEIFSTRLENLEGFFSGLDFLCETNFVVLREQDVLSDVGEVKTDEILVVSVNSFLRHYGSLFGGKSVDETTVTIPT